MMLFSSSMWNWQNKRTFDHVTMPEDHARSLRSALASHCSDNETEVIPMKKNFVRRSTSFLVAVILIAAMSVSALACGIYYVTYEVEESAEIPEDAFDLADQNADFQVDSYDYREEDGMIIVDFGETASEEDVSYEIVDDQALAEGGETVDLTEQDAEFETIPYSYTEENGKITADLSGADLD